MRSASGFLRTSLGIMGKMLYFSSHHPGKGLCANKGGSVDVVAFVYLSFAEVLGDVKVGC